MDASGAGDALTIQGGIDLSAAGDTVVIACGTYYERQIIPKDFVHIRSQTGQADCVTIDMESRGRAFWAIGIDGGSIAGITMTNGATDWGAAIYTLSLSSFDVKNCVFTNNVALVGGAVYSHHTSVSFQNCRFEDNYATYFGGGLALDHGSTNVVSDCTFVGNDAGDYGGAIWGYLLSTPTFENTTIVGNAAGRGGGGAFFQGSTPTFVDCGITRNTATVGGGLAGWGYHADLTGCTIAGNSATQRGGGIWAEERCTVDLVRTIAWGNCAPEGFATYLADASSLLSYQCSNSEDDPGAAAGPGTVTWDSESFSADPMFCEPVLCGAPASEAALLLSAGSPCLPENTGGCGLIGAFGAGTCRLPATVTPLNWGAVKALYRTGGSAR